MNCVLGVIVLHREDIWQCVDVMYVRLSLKKNKISLAQAAKQRGFNTFVWIYVYINLQPA